MPRPGCGQTLDRVVLVLFARQAECIRWPVVEAGAPPARILNRVRHLLLPQGPLAQAVHYVLSNGQALSRFTENGILAPESNLVDRAIRPIANARKAWRFTASARRGCAAADAFPLIETCKRNRVEPLPPIPSRKISETIIDFGAPLILDLEGDQPIEIVRSVFTIVIAVWNAHVMAMPVSGKPQLLEQLGELLRAAGTAPEMLGTCAELAARRQQHFADDPRAVGEWNVEFDHAGRVRLHCDARIPPSLTPPHS